MKTGEVLATLVALLRESVLVQGLITAAFVITTCFLWATGREVPDQLWTANTIVIGFFFGAKTQQVVTSFRARKGS